MKHFQQHGTFKAKREGSIIVFRATGPWNIEAMQNAADQFIQLSTPLYDSPWGMVGDFYGQAIHVPEAAEKLTEIVRIEKNRGRVATGLVTVNSELPLLVKQHLAEIYGNAGEQFQFFNNVQDAKMWVEERLIQSESVK